MHVDCSLACEGLIAKLLVSGEGVSFSSDDVRAVGLLMRSAMLVVPTCLCTSHRLLAVIRVCFVPGVLRTAQPCCIVS
jgi:hypothetical protein